MSPIVFLFIAGISPCLFGDMAQGSRTPRPSPDYLRQEGHRLSQQNSYLQAIFTLNNCDYYIRVCQHRPVGHAGGYYGKRESQQAKRKQSSHQNEYNNLVSSLQECRRCIESIGLPWSTPAPATTTTTESEYEHHHRTRTTQYPSTSAPTTTTTTAVTSVPVETTTTPLPTVETTTTSPPGGCGKKRGCPP